MRKIAKFIVILICILFSYGTIRGIYDANFNSNSSILSISLTALAMDPVSRFGYRMGIHTNPDIQIKLDKIKSNLNSIE